MQGTMQISGEIKSKFRFTSELSMVVLFYIIVDAFFYKSQDGSHFIFFRHVLISLLAFLIRYSFKIRSSLTPFPLCYLI